MRQYLAWKRGQRVDLLFVGDSITEMWRWGPGHDAWMRHFESRAIDFGLGMDRTQDVLWRLDHYDLSAWSPKVAVVLAGTNNLTDRPDDIAAGVGAIVDALRKKFRGITVVVVSILPNARANARMMAANERIRRLADGKTVIYLDLTPKFPREDDTWAGLGPDRLHLSPAGYEVFAEALEELLPPLLR